MVERLREVAKEFAADWIDLLGQQADVIDEGAKTAPARTGWSAWAKAEHQPRASSFGNCGDLGWTVAPVAHPGRTHCQGAALVAHGPMPPMRVIE
jgi:hypothetical protein